MSSPQMIEEPRITFTPPSKTPLIYVEGLSQMMLGFPNSRLVLHSFSENSDESPGVQVRKQAVELVLPTAAMVEMAQLILNSIATNKGQLEGSRKEWSEKYEALVASVVQIDSPITKAQPKG